MNDEPNPQPPDPEAAQEAAPVPSATEPLPLEEQVKKLEEDLRKLTDEVKQLSEEKQALFHQLVRRQADFENFRKRSEREQQEFRQKAELELVTALLPVLDGFELALAAPPSASHEDYRQGVELIYKQLGDILARAGLQPVEAVGKSFDPMIHHAIERVETTDHPDHQVVAELQRGYTFKQRLVRPALVRVAVQPSAPASEAESSDRPKGVN